MATLHSPSAARTRRARPLDEALFPTTEPIPVPRRLPPQHARRWPGIEPDTLKVLVLSFVLLAVVAGW